MDLINTFFIRNREHAAGKNIAKLTDAAVKLKPEFEIAQKAGKAFSPERQFKNNSEKIPWQVLQTVAAIRAVVKNGKFQEECFRKTNEHSEVLGLIIAERERLNREGFGFDGIGVSLLPEFSLDSTYTPEVIMGAVSGLLARESERGAGDAIKPIDEQETKSKDGSQMLILNKFSDHVTLVATLKRGVALQQIMPAMQSGTLKYAIKIHDDPAGSFKTRMDFDMVTDSLKTISSGIDPEKLYQAYCRRFPEWDNREMERVFNDTTGVKQTDVDNLAAERFETIEQSPEDREAGIRYFEDRQKRFKIRAEVKDGKVRVHFSADEELVRRKRDELVKDLSSKLEPALKAILENELTDKNNVRYSQKNEKIDSLVYFLKSSAKFKIPSGDNSGGNQVSSGLTNQLLGEYLKAKNIFKAPDEAITDLKGQSFHKQVEVGGERFMFTWEQKELKDQKGNPSGEYYLIFYSTKLKGNS